MAQTARIPNPVSGRIGEALSERPVTPAMVVGRYLAALLAPGWVLIWFFLADSGPHWWLLIAFVVAIYLVSALAHGSWWRSTISPGWVTASVAEAVTMFVGMVLALLWHPDAMVATCTLLIGAVLGAAAVHAWRSMHSA